MYDVFLTRKGIRHDSDRSESMDCRHLDSFDAVYISLCFTFRIIPCAYRTTDIFRYTITIPTSET